MLRLLVSSIRLHDRCYIDAVGFLDGVTGPLSLDALI